MCSTYKDMVSVGGLHKLYTNTNPNVAVIRFKLQRPQHSRSILEMIEVVDMPTGSVNDNQLRETTCIYSFVRMVVLDTDLDLELSQST